MPKFMNLQHLVSPLAKINVQNIQLVIQQDLFKLNVDFISSKGLAFLHKNKRKEQVNQSLLL